MRWILPALFVLALILMAPWEPNPSLIRLSGVLLFGVVWAIWMIRTWRSKTYLTWSRPARWAYLGLAVALAVLAASGWAITYAAHVGWFTVAWLVGWPFIYGLLGQSRPSAR